eukprot:8651627-Alexandrium_andersonii.AAC.1
MARAPSVHCIITRARIRNFIKFVVDPHPLLVLLLRRPFRQADWRDAVRADLEMVRKHSHAFADVLLEGESFDQWASACREAAPRLLKATKLLVWFNSPADRAEAGKPFVIQSEVRPELPCFAPGYSERMRAVAAAIA